jgi:hypothetical protein
VRRDDERSVLAASDGDRDGRRQSARRAAAVNDLANSADMDGVALERLNESLLELGSANRIEDLQEPGGGAADVFISLGDDAEERLAAARGSGKAIEAAMLTSPSLLIDETRDVIGLLDLLSAVQTARVRGDDVVAIGDADLIEIR